MTFMSMLQMARGKEPSPGMKSLTSNQQARQPIQNSNPAKSNSGSTGASTAHIAARPTNQSTLKTSSQPTKISSFSVQPSRNVTPTLRTNTQTPPKPVANPAARPVAKPAAKPAAKPTSSTALRTAQSDRSRASSKSYAATSESNTSNPPPPKRISFRDAMKKATSIDKSKLEISLKTTDTRKQQHISSRARERARQQTSTKQTADTGAHDISSSQQPSRVAPKHRSNSTNSVAPPSSQGERTLSSGAKAPFAQPNAKLLAKYNEKKQQQLQLKRKRYQDESDEELDDFVVSEDEEEGIDASSEIRSLFSRGSRTQYYDSGSDDDMEATGADIFNEERRSAYQARREDEEEEKKLEELQRKKKSRLR